MKIIDVMGKQCPIPIIEAKKALIDQGEESVLVKVDNFAAVQNLEKLAEKHGFSFSFIEHSKTSFEVAVVNDKYGESAGTFTESTPVTVKSGGLVVAIGRNTMGSGAEELGKILIKGFVYALTEMPVPPEYVLFFNSGVFLTSEGANTIDDLKKLEAKGTKILTCGACVNYYKIQDKVAAGTVTNMYEIVERLSGAGSVVNI